MHMFGVKGYVGTTSGLLIGLLLINVMAHAEASDLPEVPILKKSAAKSEIVPLPAFSTSHPQLVTIPERKPTPPPEPPVIPVLPPTIDGVVPVVHRVPVDKPVVFLTIDDGVHKNPADLELLRASNIKASLFLTDSVINHDYQFFNKFKKAGMRIENHTVMHPDMVKLPYERQMAEICTTADVYTNVFGRRPQLFRPPYGSYDTITKRAAAACGMKALVMWHAVAEHGAMQYQQGDHLQPGDIVLMHFTPEFAQDLQAFITAQNAAGLHTELLETYLGVE